MDTTTNIWDQQSTLNHRKGPVRFVAVPRAGREGGRFFKSSGQVGIVLTALLGTTLATVEGAATKFASLTGFGQPLKLATEVPKPADLGDASLPNPAHQTPSLPPNAIINTNQKTK